MNIIEKRKMQNNLKKEYDLLKFYEGRNRVGILALKDDENSDYYRAVYYLANKNKRVCTLFRGGII